MANKVNMGQVGMVWSGLGSIVLWFLLLCLVLESSTVNVFQRRDSLVGGEKLAVTVLS